MATTITETLYNLNVGLVIAVGICDILMVVGVVLTVVMEPWS